MQSLTREIMRLAVPAFGALVAEPLFLLIDSAVVGRLGTSALAGLGVASSILLTLVGLFVFLAYGTTSVVARKLGAGDRSGALTSGVDGIWLSLLLGALTCGVTVTFAEPLVNLFGASATSATQSISYLRVSTFGIPSMLVVLSATGTLRGLQDTLTPLVASGAGFSLNAVLSWLLVHPLNFGISGAAWATVIAQTGMAIALVWSITKKVRQEHATLNFDLRGVWRAGLGGIPLLIRTLALRIVLVLTTWTAANLGDGPLAAHQVAMTVWSSLAFALDALAIAAQALVGRALGAGETDHVHVLTAKLVRWGSVYGVGLGIFLFAIHRFVPLGFTSDSEVASALSAALIVVAAAQPLAGIAFVLDGVLIGAGDSRWLAGAQLVFMLAYLPAVFALHANHLHGTTGLVWLWIAFSGVIMLRALGLWWRSRQDAWLVVGQNQD